MVLKARYTGAIHNHNTKAFSQRIRSRPSVKKRLRKHSLKTIILLMMRILQYHKEHNERNCSEGYNNAPHLSFGHNHLKSLPKALSQYHLRSYYFFAEIACQHLLSSFVLTLSPLSGAPTSVCQAYRRA